MASVMLRVSCRLRSLRGGFQPSFLRNLTTDGALSDEEVVIRQELAKQAHREVQVARRRRREQDDEIILFRSAEAAGFSISCQGDDELKRRRHAIDQYVTTRAHEMMEGIAARKPLKEVVDFELEVAPSRELPQPLAGEGVFVKAAANGEIPAGTLVAFYPGSVYMPHEVRWLGGYGPALERAGQTTSSHVIGRVGGVRIDGLWSGIQVENREFDLDDVALDAVLNARLEAENVDSDVARQAAKDDLIAFREGLTSALRRPSAEVPCPIHEGEPSQIRALNPFAVGEMVNHPPNGRTANVMGWPVDLDLFGRGPSWARAAPNAFALRPEGSAAPGAPCPYTVVLLTAEALKPGDELYLDYGCELLPVEDIPVWFTPAALRGNVDEKDSKQSPAIAIRDELHAWRTNFETIYGRRPERHDLLGDPVASALFETFQKYRKLGDL